MSKLETILSAIGKDWTTYRQIHHSINKVMSVGKISSLIWNNIDLIKDKIEWDAEVFGDKPWQIRMRFRIIKKCCKEAKGYYLGTVCPSCLTPFREVLTPSTPIQ